MRRGVTGHVTEEIALKTQVLDVRAALATLGDHDCHLGEHLATVLNMEAFAPRCDP